MGTLQECANNDGYMGQSSVCMFLHDLIYDDLPINAGTALYEYLTNIYEPDSGSDEKNICNIIDDIKTTLLKGVFYKNSLSKEELIRDAYYEFESVPGLCWRHP